MKIEFPEGMRLLECVNNDIPVCNECGAIMERRENPGYCDVFVCPNCGCKVDEMDYEFEESEDDYDWDDEEEDDNQIPKGCAACGGPYP